MHDVQITLTLRQCHLSLLGEFLTSLETTETTTTQKTKPKAKSLKTKKDSSVEAQGQEAIESQQAKTWTTNDCDLTLTDLRTLAVEKTKAGKKDEVLAAIKDAGADMLPDVPPENWGVLHAALSNL